MPLFRCRIHRVLSPDFAEQDLHAPPERLVEAVQALVEGLDDFDLVEVFDEAGSIIFEVISNTGATRH